MGRVRPERAWHGRCSGRRGGDAGHSKGGRRIARSGAIAEATMTAPARLLALRLQGFKSFGERTLVEFGPGISAVVGPNGSGKSNLADALRWALGEQGRALRLRKSEDVIFAGSDKRSALGMADVTLVFGNSDRLLPIDFDTVELGRRLFRSGENDYLLNKQRVRLRDLVDLLDAAHLADNAFLFIGQGMVDQALALRPEERRPLFEEVAGVRRHERRKRKAEEQLEEAESNLARVDDVLAELRPQARRLAAQAEQQASRQTAGREYGRAIIAVARFRWREAAGRARQSENQLATGRTQIDAALGALRDAEETVAAIARDLVSGSEVEAERRTTQEAARARLTELQLRDARALADVSAGLRDRQRLEEELAVAEADLAVQRREQAAPVPSRDLALSAAVAESERSLSEALEELSAARAEQQAQGEALAALRRVESARAAEVETARRRLSDAERQATDERVLSDEATRRLAESEEACAGPKAALTKSIEDEKAAVAVRESARTELDRREGARQTASERASAAASRVAGLRGRLEGLQGRLAEDETRGIAKAARRAGGKPLSDGLEVEAGFRVAVEAALGETMRGYVVGREAALELDGQRGVLVLEAADVDELGKPALRDSARDRAIDAGAAAVAAAVGQGGGRLVETVRVDPGGAAIRLLARSVWVPDLNAALTVHPKLPAGWVAVTREGVVVTALGVVSMGRAESLLERRAEVERLAGEVSSLAADATAAATRAAEAAKTAATARVALESAREAARRARAAAAANLDQERIASLERQTADLVRREQEIESRRESLGEELAAAALREAAVRLELEELRADAAVARTRLADAETAAGQSRERLRACQERVRGVEVAELEARLSLEAIREQVLVELAGMGDLGIRLLINEASRTRTGAGLLDEDDDAPLPELRALPAALAARSGQRDDSSMTGEAGDDDTEADRDITLELMLSAATERWAEFSAVEPTGTSKLAALRRRFHELGAPNPFAAEEYEQIRTRLEGLEAQRADLTAAISKTRALIEQLNAMIATQFRSTFAALETAFDVRFRQLFGGGYARLSLTEPEDLASTGIEIVARPPGKKAQALSMLSGGERALTAVALLFAMLEVHPVPFCVLDEVDAALDEANVGRFAEALRGLADQTQIIVITHNRGTIEVADALYGVTVSDDAVSRVISLRLEEARDLADRATTVSYTHLR